MSDFFENFSDEIEDNAGAYAALGGLAALKNQNAQKVAIDEVKKQLAKIEGKNEKEARIKRALVNFEEYLDGFDTSINSPDKLWRVAKSLNFQIDHFKKTIKFDDIQNPSSYLSEIEAIKYARTLEKKARAYDLKLKPYNEIFKSIVLKYRYVLFDRGYLNKVIKANSKSRDVLDYFVNENITDFTLPSGLYEGVLNELEFSDERKKLSISDKDYYSSFRYFNKIINNPKFNLYKVINKNTAQLVGIDTKAKKIDLYDESTKVTVKIIRDEISSSEDTKLISLSHNKEFFKHNVSRWEKDDFVVNVSLLRKLDCAFYDVSAQRREFNKIIGSIKVSKLVKAVSDSSFLNSILGLSFVNRFIDSTKNEIENRLTIEKKRKALAKRNTKIFLALFSVIFTFTAVTIYHSTQLKYLPYVSNYLEGIGIKSRAKNIYESYERTSKKLSLIDSDHKNISVDVMIEHKAEIESLKSVITANEAKLLSEYALVSEIESSLEDINNLKRSNYDATKKYYDQTVKILLDINEYIRSSDLPYEYLRVPKKFPLFQEYTIFNYLENKEKLNRFIPSFLVNNLNDSPGVTDLIKDKFSNSSRWTGNIGTDTDNPYSVPILNYGFGKLSGYKKRSRVDIANSDWYTIKNTSGIFLTGYILGKRYYNPLVVGVNNDTLYFNPPGGDELFRKLNPELRYRIVKLHTSVLTCIASASREYRIINNLDNNITALFKRNFDAAEYYMLKEKVNVLKSQLRELENQNVDVLKQSKIFHMLAKEKELFRSRYGISYDSLKYSDDFQEFRVNLESTKISNLKSAQQEANQGRTEPVSITLLKEKEFEEIPVKEVEKNLNEKLKKVSSVGKVHPQPETILPEISQLNFASDALVFDKPNVDISKDNIADISNAVKKDGLLFKLKDLDEKPRMINFVKPEKPYQLRIDRVKGYTKVRFMVDENGEMMYIEKFSETSHSSLEDSVRDVFKKWKMTAPMKNGKPVKAVVELPIKF